MSKVTVPGMDTSPLWGDVFMGLGMSMGALSCGFLKLAGGVYIYYARKCRF